MELAEMVSELPPRGSISWERKLGAAFRSKAEMFSKQVAQQLESVELPISAGRLSPAEIAYVSTVCGETMALSQELLEVEATLRIKFGASKEDASYKHGGRLITIPRDVFFPSLVIAYRHARDNSSDDYAVSLAAGIELLLRAVIAHECYHQHQNFRYPRNAMRSGFADWFSTVVGSKTAYCADLGEYAARLFSYGLLRRQREDQLECVSSWAGGDTFEGRLEVFKAVWTENIIKIMEKQQNCARQEAKEADVRLLLGTAFRPSPSSPHSTTP